VANREALLLKLCCSTSLPPLI